MMGPPSYRTIQPAPVRGSRSGALSGPSGPQWLGTKGLTKRLKAVTQACHTCRRNKAKCDGVRPKCGSCTTRNTPCGYDGEAGQSRQAALRARLEELEKLFGGLVAPDYQEAKRLLDRIRASANDLTPLLASNSEPEDRYARQGTVASSSDASESSYPSHSSNASPAASGSSSAGTTVGTALSSADDAPNAMVADSPPSRGSTQTQRPLPDDLSSLLHLDLPLPGAKTTWAGVQSFFGSTGKLFHVYSEQQMEAYHTAVFGVDGKPDTSRRLELCSLYALAAVGILYNAGTFQKGLEKIFHDVSRRFFSEVMEERPLDTIKVCTLYAMYNVLDKATVALAYVEVGLGMSKRQSQNTGVCHPSKVTSEEWIDFRRTWRALVFFSKHVAHRTHWLSSTLGYISGADDGEFARLLPVAGEDEDSYTAELGELIQAEMTKIVLLKAGILRNHLAVPELTALGMDGIIRELQDWHEQLPEPMKLRSLYRTDWPPVVRWSIYHLHLLYHGAFMLVYRRIAAHCVRLQRAGAAATESAFHEPNLMNLVEQGVTSARDTARIVNLLLGEQGVFRRCWIVIFQAHTACVVILHSVAQRQLHGFPASSWADDMQLAQQCINVLAYCGDIDPVALRFRVRLSGIYDSLQHTAATAPSSYPTVHHPDPEPHPIEYLFTAIAPPSSAPSPSPSSTSPSPIPPPQPSAELSNLSLTLLFALCRPWSDPAGLNTVAGPGTTDMAAAATVARDCSISASATSCGGGGPDQTQLLDKLEWDFEKVTPFRWDTDGVGGSSALLREGEVVGTSCFLDSEAPSGWKMAEDVEVDG
ncbi:hypothetical protein C7999DRAFT_41873 [Corynascus novoguineensis]|uniref:Zn(2)-C6 fungal-type domain-containing protein n=1 Tax=Corynascus novoguineensis TaxID=1126955 RepID=A0AAN7CSV8_9PEZI|nr:hypothetical protein C7999DRAFT_41873 [Corynascus novoguineensis]